MNILSINSMAEIIYTYSTGTISHYAVKKVDDDCRLLDKDKTISCGVFCKSCKHFHSICRFGVCNYVLCTHPQAVDSSDVEGIREEINSGLRQEAIAHYYD